MSLISDDDEHSLGAFAAATDMNPLTPIHAIAGEHRVIHGFPKREFIELLPSSNATGSSDQVHDTIRKK
jgi:hypothetical protein